MKKKMLALLLAAAMAIQPLNVAGAAEFTDGESVSAGTEEEVVEQEAEASLEMFTDDVSEEQVVKEKKTTEGRATSSETTIQMGDNVTASFNKAERKVIISGSGAMWDYLSDGGTLDKHENPFRQWLNVQEIVFEGKITHISNNLKPGNSLRSVIWSEGLTSIGNSAFGGCRNLMQLNLPEGITSIGDGAFSSCSSLSQINLPDSITSIGDGAFSSCSSLSQINLPDSITSIGDYAFSDCGSLSQIQLPEGITSIGDYAFSGCRSLSQIQLPEGITSIGNGAFSDCQNLSQINLPDSIISIGNSAFAYCVRLDNVCIPQGIFELQNDIFRGCSFLSNVTLQEGLQEIYYRAFQGCIRLESITIPSSVVHIDGNSFYGCESLKTIKGYTCSGAKKYYDSLPEDQKQKITFESLGEGTHQWSIEKITIKESTCEEPGEKAFRCAICGKTKDSESLEPLGHNWSNWSTIKEPTETEEGERKRTCRSCRKMEKEPIPKLSPIKFEYKSVDWQNYDKLSIFARVNKRVHFYVECKKVNEPEPKFDESKLDKAVETTDRVWQEISVPEEPVTVYLFVQDADGNNTCTILAPFYDERPEKPATTIQVGDNITATIEGDTLTLTGSGATYDYGEDDSSWYEGNQDEIKKVVFNGNITRIGDFFFSSFKGINKIKLPEGVTELGESVFRYCTGIEELELPSTLKRIPSFRVEMYGDDVFPNLKTLIISEGISSIGNYAFSGCRSLSQIHLPDSLTSIGDGAFKLCSSLSQIKLPENLTNIGDAVFCDCTSLKKINLPEELVQMGGGVFANCSALNELIFPSSLKCIPHIGENCGITKIFIPEGVLELAYGAFSGCNNLSDIQLPSTIESIGEAAFESTGITSLTWPEKVTTIPDETFCGSSIEKFTVPDTVKEICSSAFESCYNLTKITIPSSVKYIRESAFHNSRNVTIYGDRDSVAERYAYINNIPFVSDCYKIIFKEDGRTKETEYVKKGENATPPTLTPRPGYTLSWDADYTNITEDMVINAVWTKDGADKPEPPIIVYPPSDTKYTVTFKDRGKVIKTEKVISGEAADFPYVSRYGYELSWDKDFSKVTSNMTVNAVWTVIKPTKITSFTAEALPKYARLSWDRNEYTDYYVVYRKLATDKTFKQISKTTKVLWNDKKVKPGNEYQYKVIAVASVEGKKYQSEASEIVTVKIGKPEAGDIYSVGKLNYKIMNSSEVRVTGLAKNTAVLSIPTAVSISGKSYKVTSIDQKAFYKNENLMNVKIGNNINYIGKYAFYQCPNLETVKFGSKIRTISTCAFTQCPKLENVTLPSSLEQIGAKAFYQCKSIKILSIKSSKLKYLGKKALAVNSKITIRVPKAKYSAYVKMIQKSGKYSKTKFQKF